MSKPADTTSYVYRMGTSPNTRVAVTQKNKVYGYTAENKSFQQIGVVSEFGHDESRTIEAVRGVGFGDQIAELVPSVTEPMTLTLNKTLLYAFNLFQSVGYLGGVDGLVRSLKHHRWPFDIKQEIVISEVVRMFDMDNAPGTYSATKQGNSTPNPDPAAAHVNALFTFYEGCWFNSYSASYTADAAIVAENGSVTVTDVLDGFSTYGEFINSGLSAGAAGASGAAGAGFSLRFAGGSNSTSVNATPGV